MDRNLIRKLKNFLKEEKKLGYTDIVNVKKIDFEPLAKLEEEVKKCRKCELSKSRINTVFGEGNPKAKVIFIGEGPGYEEDRQGKPFVGKAGQLLTKIIESIGLKRSEVYIANVVKCHPMVDPEKPDIRGNDRPPTQEEVMACLPFLEKQIEIINPEFIITLGNSAAQAILGISDGVAKIRGKIYKYKNIRVIPTYHPAALLRNPKLKIDTWKDMKLLRSQLSQK